MSAEISYERAQRDITDIKALESNEGFNRYWMGRLRQIRERLHSEFLNNPSLNKDEREVARRLVLEYDALLTMMASDLKVCTEMVERTAANHSPLPIRPTQAC